MFGIGPWELMLVFAIVLLLFGGKRLPGIASGLGSAIRNFKTALKEPESSTSSNNNLLESPKINTEQKNVSQSNT
jgi:sec-independent protein translocase protein TatA